MQPDGQPKSAVGEAEKKHTTGAGENPGFKFGMWLLQPTIHETIRV